MLGARSAIALALVALATAGSACGSDQSGSAPEVVTANGAELTERQVEMVEVADAYIAAWSDTDGEAVASHMTSDAYVTYPERDETFFVEDGTLQQRVSNGPYATLHAHTPMTVYDDRIVVMGSIDALDLDWLSVIRFTSSGDPKIVSETLFL